DRFRLHQARRAAAKEHAAGHAVRRHRAKPFDLFREGGGKALLIHRLVADMGVEIAIGAFGGAERPMHIHAENWRASGVHARGSAKQRPASAMKARARCESPWPVFQSTPCFSSALISPNVRSCPSGRKIGS